MRGALRGWPGRGGGSGLARVQQPHGMEKELRVVPDTAWAADLELGRGSCPGVGPQCHPKVPLQPQSSLSGCREAQEAPLPAELPVHGPARPSSSATATRSRRQGGAGPGGPRGAGADLLLDLQAGVQQPGGAGEWGRRCWQVPVPAWGSPAPRSTAAAHMLQGSGTQTLRIVS